MQTAPAEAQSRRRRKASAVQEEAGVSSSITPRAASTGSAAFTLPPFDVTLPSAPLVAEGDTDGTDAAGGDGAASKKRRRGGARGGDGESKTAAAAAAAASAYVAAELEAASAAEGGAVDELTAGASLLAPTSQQQRLVEEAFPEAAGGDDDFEAEKAKLVEREAPRGEESTEMPGWGSWGGLGARPDPRAERRKRSAADARAKLLEQAAAQRKDAALKNVIISEKRNKKAATFTTAGVPYPFTSREQFERSLRAPLGREWNTTASHKALTAPGVVVAKGVAINAIATHHKAPAGGRSSKAK